jgi:hypothetical protein
LSQRPKYFALLPNVAVWTWAAQSTIDIPPVAREKKSAHSDPL